MKERFDTIYNNYSKMLYNYLIRHVRNEQDAFDIMQETFFKLIKNIKNKRKELAFYSCKKYMEVKISLHGLKIN